MMMSTYAGFQSSFFVWKNRVLKRWKKNVAHLFLGKGLIYVWKLSFKTATFNVNSVFSELNSKRISNSVISFND